MNETHITYAHGRWKGHNSIKQANEILKQEKLVSTDLSGSQISSEIMSRDETRGYNVDIAVGRLSVEWNTLFSIRERGVLVKKKTVICSRPLIWSLTKPHFSCGYRDWLASKFCLFSEFLFFPTCFCFAEVLTLWQRTWQHKSKFRSPPPPPQKLSFPPSFLISIPQVSSDWLFGSCHRSTL